MCHCERNEVERSNLLKIKKIASVARLASRAKRASLLRNDMEI